MFEKLPWEFLKMNSLLILIIIILLLINEFVVISPYKNSLIFLSKTLYLSLDNALVNRDHGLQL